MARFNYNSKCAHPIVCKRLMKEFIQDLTTEKVKLKEDDNFYTIIANDTIANGILIGYNFKILMEICYACFRQNFFSRANYAKGFSSVTLVLLHELGHQKIKNTMPSDYYPTKRNLNVFRIRQDYNEKRIDELKFHSMYMALPDEFAATQWAIDWLAAKENRQKAKKFEKKFFKAWRGK